MVGMSVHGRFSGDFSGKEVIVPLVVDVLIPENHSARLYFVRQVEALVVDGRVVVVLLRGVPR